MRANVRHLQVIRATIPTPRRPHMSFTIHEPSPVETEPEFDCIFCEKPALHSSEAARTDTTRTVEVFCRHCGARKTMSTRLSEDGNRWELAE
jgi:transcription elongation factor Elf1